ncbi:dentin matrix acidic phosphoprotein 1-like [Symsagittifera roscoffensis]|uniref:dentin matrix acidic phosphoprotein 1-like n=1 Tax=Symsagittifera roscoffensis TaxID=84072 RepID=UPI00307BBF98
MVETRSQKSSEGQKAMLEVEVHLDPALDEDQRDMDRKGEETEERVKNTLGNFFPFTMGTGTGDEAETQEEEEDDDGQDDFGSQVSLSSSTQENGAYADRETGTMEQFGVVRTISNTIKESGQSRDCVNMTNPEMRTGQSRITRLSNAPADPEVDSEKTSRQRIKARISTSTKLPGIDRERMDEHLAKNLSRLTGEAEQRELRLRDDMERLRIQQEQTLETLDTKIDAMMEKRTQAIMDRFDGLLSSRSGPKRGESKSGEPSREPRVNLNEQQNRRRTYEPSRGRGSSSGYTTRDNRPRGPNIGGSSKGKRKTSNERPTQDTHATGRCDSRNRSHASQGRNNPSESDRRENLEPLSGGKDTQAGHSKDAASMATAFEPLNRTLETFLTRLSRTNERSEKSRRVFKKPRCYKDESDGCIDTWIEVMRLHCEEEDLTERQECSALTSNLEGTALNSVMPKKQY